MKKHRKKVSSVFTHLSALSNESPDGGVEVIHCPLLCSNPWKRSPVRPMNSLAEFPERGFRENCNRLSQITSFRSHVRVEKRLRRDFKCQVRHLFFNVNNSRVRQPLPCLSDALRFMNHRVSIGSEALYVECRLD